MIKYHIIDRILKIAAKKQILGLLVFDVPFSTILSSSFEIEEF
jgi:hypothetical protein